MPRKVIQVDMIGQSMLSQILRRFERETKALARMSHPNIVNAMLGQATAVAVEVDMLPQLVFDYFLL